MRSAIYLCPVIMAWGCFDPTKTGSAGESAGTDDDGSTATTPTTESPATESPTSASPTSESPTEPTGAVDSTGTPGESSGSTGAPVGECGDGEIDVGQLCLAEYAEIPVAFDPQRIGVADLDGNGHLDLVMGSPSALFSSLGAGDGNFTQAAASTAATDPNFAIGMVDDDAIPDVAYVVQFDRWGISYGAGTGAMTPSPFEVYGNEAYATGFAIGDFDGAGDADIAVAIPFQQSIRFFRHDGQLPSGAQPVGAGAEFLGDTCGSIVVADLSGGAFPHLVVGCEEGYVLVLDPLGDGTFVLDGNFTAGNAVADVAACDVDLDGNLDVVTANPADHVVAVFRGDGLGGLVFPPDELDVAGTPDQEPVAVACGDLDGDGDADLVTANLAGGSISIIEGLGAEGFANFPTVIAVNGERRRDPSDVAIADVDEDGAPDILVANAYHDASQEPVDFASVGVFLSDP